MSCHHDPARNEIVDNCVSCHATAAAVYAGTYEDLDLPDFMFDEGIVCEDCHLAGQTVARPQPSVCADCHDDEYPEMLVEWKSEFRDLAADVRSMIDQIPATRRDTDAFRRALRVLNELGPDAVTGIHNSELTRELLSEIRSDLGSPAPVDED